MTCEYPVPMVCTPKIVSGQPGSGSTAQVPTCLAGWTKRLCRITVSWDSWQSPFLFTESLSFLFILKHPWNQVLRSSFHCHWDLLMCLVIFLPACYRHLTECSVTVFFDFAWVCLCFCWLSFCIRWSPDTFISSYLTQAHLPVVPSYWI